MKFILAMIIPFVLLAQIERWVYTYNGNLNHIDVAEALTCGLDGNIYAVGRTANVGTSSDFLVISFKDNGDTNWIYMYNPMNLEDIAFAVDYGLDHNIYVAGMSSAPATYSDFTVLSLTTGGDTNWVYRHDGPGTIEDYDAAHAITCGLDGNIYAGGTSNAHIGGGDFFVVSLSAAGDTNWTYRHGGTAASGGTVKAIAYGADGNIYAAGDNWDVASYYDLLVVSLSTAGDTNWTYCYGGTLGDDAAHSVAYGLDGNIYVAGYSIGADSCWYFTVISLTDDGDENWVFRYPSDIMYIFIPAGAIVYGLDNNIYAAGKCLLPGQTEDFLVVSLSTAGDTNWTYQLNGKANDRDFAKGIVYGSDGNIYAAGMVCDELRGPDFTVVCLAADGTENWLYTYSAVQSYRWDEAYAIDYGLDGNIYAAGEDNCGAGGFWDYDFTVVSLQPTTGIEETNTDCAQLVRLNAMPNPFSKLTNIRCSIVDTGYSIENPALRIFDASGRLVKSFYQELSIPGSTSQSGTGQNQGSVVSWDGTDAAGKQVPAGVYFVTLEADNRRASEKILLVR
jgi:hypothetical protein